MTANGASSSPSVNNNNNNNKNNSDYNFATCYLELCRQQRLRPLPMICVTLPHSLDFTTDRVKMDDWTPILNSLSLDRSLRSISVRSKYQAVDQYRHQYRKLLDEANSESKARAVGKAPVVLTRFLVEWLSHSVGQCVRYSACLTSLELDGIPVPVDCLAVLCVGLASTKCLQHLSLQRCYIGDAGCELLCRKVADVHSVRSLNLSQCELTGLAGQSLASALSRQKLSLYHDAWKQSLRYREPKLDSMPGLRRLTLNGNSKLGNEAVMGIIEAIRDSLWFKALDLQQCGLTEPISRDILELLEHNNTLLIVDVRLNSALSDENLAEITRRLARNDLHVSKSSEYRWLNLPQSKDSSTSVNKRVSSAGNLRKEEAAAAAAKSLTRPRSAIIRQVKRPPPPVAYRKPLLPIAQIANQRMKTKPPVPVFERKPRQPMKPPEHARLPMVEKVETPPKVSLHLDLQSQIQSFADPMQKDVGLTVKPEEPTVILNESLRLNEVQQNQQQQQQQQTEKLQEILNELFEMRKERDRLVEECRENEHLLAEERARREFAEAKLRSAKSDLGDMEDAMRRRDRDSRGYLLISQKSMQELCLSFHRLLEMLDQSSSSTLLSPTSPDQLNRLESSEEIKRRVAIIIRKTKSENLKRGYLVSDETRRGASEANIRTNNGQQQQQQSIEAPIRVERPTGDIGGPTVNLPRLVANFRGESRDEVCCANNKGNTIDSPGRRARAIFASIISAEASLNFNAAMR